MKHQNHKKLHNALSVLKILIFSIHILHEVVRTIFVLIGWLLIKGYRKKTKASVLVLLVLSVSIPTAFFVGRRLDVASAATAKQIEVRADFGYLSDATTPPTVQRKKKLGSRIESEKKFVSQMKNLFPQDKNAGFQYIYEDALKNDLPPYLVAGIAWKESNFHENRTSPQTSFGYSRGEMQILDATATNFGFNPKLSLNQEDNILEGTEILHAYAEDFMGTGSPFYQKHFRLQNGVIQYRLQTGRWHNVVDQNGEHVPDLLLATYAYNGGPLSIVRDLNLNDGVLVLDPQRHSLSLSDQQLDYAIKIQKLYNFGFQFPYQDSEINQSTLLYR